MSVVVHLSNIFLYFDNVLIELKQRTCTCSVLLDQFIISPLLLKDTVIVTKVIHCFKYLIFRLLISVLLSRGQMKIYIVIKKLIEFMVVVFRKKIKKKWICLEIWLKFLLSSVQFKNFVSFQQTFIN